MRPNILLITADQWRGDCLGVAGHPVVRTPHLDRLAAEGVYFANHFAQAAPCGPSRASLYTGLYQMNHRVVGNGTPLDRRHDNLALALRRLGYDPTLFGHTDQAVDPRAAAADSPWLRTYEGILSGFSVELFLPESQEVWVEWLASRGVQAADRGGIHMPATGPSRHPTNAPPVYSADETPTAFLTDRFLSWLGERKTDTPWCAHVSFISPHPPFIVPSPFNTLYDPANGPPFRRAANAAGERGQHPLLDYILDVADRDPFVRGVEPGLVADWSDQDFRVIRSLYWGMIAEVDGQIGRILDAVAGSDTVIAFTSDHGDMMGDHWALGKFGYFDQAFHVPLIIHDPRRTAGGGRKVSAFTESVDLLPTLIEAAGGLPSRTLDGASLTPFLDGQTPGAWRDAVHWEYDFREVETGASRARFGLDLDSCSLAVRRDHRFKYVHFAGLPPLLFDLAEDPDELRDRSRDPPYQAVRLEYAEALLAWRARHLDRTLTGILLTPDGPLDARG